MKKYILQGKKDAIKADLVAIYSFTTDEGVCEMLSTAIDGKKNLERGTLLTDGRVLVEILPV